MEVNYDKALDYILRTRINEQSNPNGNGIDMTKVELQAFYHIPKNEIDLLFEKLIKDGYIDINRKILFDGVLFYNSGKGGYVNARINVQLDKLIKWIIILGIIPVIHSLIEIFKIILHCVRCN